MSTDNNKDDGFWAALKKSYEDEEAARKRDDAPLAEKLADGAIGGVVETASHPFRWLRSILKLSK
jgi:hypothetical protein